MKSLQLAFESIAPIFLLMALGYWLKQIKFVGKETFDAGASFTFSSIKGYRKEISVVVLTRLVIVPLLMLSAAAVLGFRNEAIACLLVISGSPVAVSSFAMAQQMGGDEELAAQSIVISSACCLLTLFVWIFLLSRFGLV